MNATARRRHVLIVVENMSVPSDRRVWKQATSLRSLGYDVSVICPRSELDAETRTVVDGIEIHRHDVPAAAGGAVSYALEYATALVWELRLALRVHRRHAVDVVHICNPPDLLFLVAGVLKLLTGARVVFDHHDLAPELFVDKFGRRGLLHRVLLATERWSMRLADVVISTNDSYRARALQRGGRASDDVYVVRNGPRLQTFTPGSRRVDGGPPVVGYVGHMGPQDGVDLLVQVADIVNNHRGRDFEFLLIGDGPELDAVRDLAARLGLGGHFTFTGWLKDEAELVARLRTTDICVAPDPKTEFNDHSTMIKTLEYMALGKPIVLFDLVEGRRAVGDAGRYASADDLDAFAGHIIALADDDELRAELGRRARQRVETIFAWELQVPALAAAYDRALSARTGA